jgi:quinoprotein glucose dehydrogenase
VFQNDNEVETTKVFLDIESKVVYKDKQNEEGLLGLAFHPKYKKNGEFIVYYTTTSAPHTSFVSRFRVSKDDPDHAESSSEEVLLRIPQPFWNHNGGTVAFGPDGYLYIALGDGGKANDPQMNGQNLNTLLGSVLRIDVDRKGRGLKYGIPRDNPFVNQKGLARPEIWAYGVRNIWRLSFDRKTGTCWAGDVGQNIWEEINILVRGGNYGWNIREANHNFGLTGIGANKVFIDPIWEYDHKIGKSITGGHVYRGQKTPQLNGHYIYGDYVTGLIWGLKYDEKSKKVLANRPISGLKLPIMSFGEDQAGEIYFTTPLGSLFTFEAKAE